MKNAVDVFTPSKARRALDELLLRHPHLDVLKIEWGEPDEARASPNPWMLVTLGQPSRGVHEAWARWEFAIWKRTGSVFAVALGAVGEDPIIIIEDD